MRNEIADLLAVVLLTLSFFSFHGSTPPAIQIYSALSSQQIPLYPCSLLSAIRERAA